MCVNIYTHVCVCVRVCACKYDTKKYKQWSAMTINTDTTTNVCHICVYVCHMCVYVCHMCVCVCVTCVCHVLGGGGWKSCSFCVAPPPTHTRVCGGGNQHQPHNNTQTHACVTCVCVSHVYVCHMCAGGREEQPAHQLMCVCGGGDCDCVCVCVCVTCVCDVYMNVFVYVFVRVYKYTHTYSSEHTLQKKLPPRFGSLARHFDVIRPSCRTP